MADAIDSYDLFGNKDKDSSDLQGQGYIEFDISNISDDHNSDVNIHRGTKQEPGAVLERVSPGTHSKKYSMQQGDVAWVTRPEDVGITRTLKGAFGWYKG